MHATCDDRCEFICTMIVVRSDVRARSSAVVCTWSNGCCARHPTARVCKEPARSSLHGAGGLEELATAPIAAETPAERERAVVGLRRAAERRAMLERKFQERTSAGLFYLSPPANRSAMPHECTLLAKADEASSSATAPRQPIPPLQVRTDLVALLEAEHMTRGVEVGVKKGRFAHALLSGWRACESYTLVDLWQSQHNYRDRANVNNSQQERNMRITLKRLKPYARQLSVCRDLSTVCAARLRDGSVDFVYIDARHDYKGVLDDIAAYWPKLRVGGLMGGHDYLTASEIPRAGV
eukprot:2531902-Prymnesium_polylepis.1